MSNFFEDAKELVGDESLAGREPSIFRFMFGYFTIVPLLLYFI
jgi:hypothetical protein